MAISERAILSHRVISFDYYGQNGAMSHRLAEPLQLLFKEYTWYLRAFCREKNDMRLFKLLRMKRVEMTEEFFVPQKYEEKAAGTKLCKKADSPVSRDIDVQDDPHLTMLTLLIDKSEAFRIYDRFEEEEITVLENGDFLVRVKYLVDEWVYGVIFSFGPSVKVLGPEEVKDEVIRRLRKMQMRYEQE